MLGGHLMSKSSFFWIASQCPSLLFTQKSNFHVFTILQLIGIEFARTAAFNALQKVRFSEKAAALTVSHSLRIMTGIYRSLTLYTHGGVQSARIKFVQRLLFFFVSVSCRYPQGQRKGVAANKGLYLSPLKIFYSAE